MKTPTLAILTVFLAPLLAQAEIVEKKIDYKIGDQTYEGTLVMSSKSKGKNPGVLVVHDWMGATAKTIEKAHGLAELGYVAFVADIYGKGVRPTALTDASALATGFKKDRKKYREHLNAALDQLKAQPSVDVARLAATGYCFGGTGVIELARSGAPIKAVVSFHGGLDSPTPADGKNIKAKVLALHGADDPYVPAADVAAFAEEMRQSHVDWQLVQYGGAVHSFTDKSAGNDNAKGAAYNQSADRRSWQAMKDFLKEVL